MLFRVALGVGGVMSWQFSLQPCDVFGHLLDEEPWQWCFMTAETSAVLQQQSVMQTGCFFLAWVHGASVVLVHSQTSLKPTVNSPELRTWVSVVMLAQCSFSNVLHSLWCC